MPGVMAVPPPPSGALVLASALRRGQRAVVAAIDAVGTDAERLASLGLVIGAAVHVHRGGAPMVVAVDEARFALGREWAERLRVAVL